MFVANVNYFQACVSGKGGEQSATWENQDLKVVQGYFFSTFHKHHDFFDYKFLSGTITDTATGNTWDVDSYGKKRRCKK